MLGSIPTSSTSFLWRGHILIGRELDCESGKCEFKPHWSPQRKLTNITLMYIAIKQTEVSVPNPYYSTEYRHLEPEYVIEIKRDYVQLEHAYAEIISKLEAEGYRIFKIVHEVRTSVVTSLHVVDITEPA